MTDKKKEERRLLAPKSKEWFIELAMAAMETGLSGEIDYIMNFAEETQTPGVFEMLAKRAGRRMN